MQKTKLIKDVENITTILENLSLKLNIPLSDLKVKIENFHSYIKNKNKNIFELLDNNENEIDDDIFENKNYDFKQTYDIVVFTKDKKDDFHIEIKDNFEKLYLILHQNFIPPKNDDEFNNFINKLNVMKATNNIFLRKLKEEENIIKNAFEKFKNKEGNKNDTSIILATAKNFISSKDAFLEFQIEGIELSKVNYIAIKENTLICEFHFPKKGVNGRNLSGVFIEIKEFKNNAPKITSDFKEIKDEENSKYYSIQSGFAIFKQNTFEFKRELNFSNLQTKNNYIFLGSLDTKTSIIVNTENEFEDALKSGMSILASKIIVNGNIASYTKIQAKEVEIKGQTHKDSNIIASNTKINVHKGYLYSDSVKINNLENGNINANDIEINKSNGGSILGNNININELYSNSDIQFANKCIINHLKGGGNKIVFTPMGNKKTRENITELEKNLNALFEKEKITTLKYNSLLYKYKKFKDVALNLKKTIEINQKEGKKTPSYVKNNYYSFLNIIDSMKNTKIENMQIQNEKNKIIQNLKEEQKIIFDAEFVCKDGWLKYNDVVFTLIEPKTNSTKTIIKGVGRYYFSLEEKKIIYQKIFKNNNENINNLGF